MFVAENKSGSKGSPSAKETERAAVNPVRILNKHSGSNSSLNLGMVDQESELKQRYNIRVLKPNHLMTHVNPITQEPIKMHSIPSVSSHKTFESPYDVF